MNPPSATPRLAWWRRLWSLLFSWRPRPTGPAAEPEPAPLLDPDPIPVPPPVQLPLPLVSGSQPEGNPAPAWCALGCSVQGAQHVRHGQPNQDALLWLPDSGQGPPLILAVADGHGSARCFRSQVGSRLAVQTATQHLLEFVQSWRDTGNLSLVKRAAEDFLPQKITQSWTDAVGQHLAAEPFTDQEREHLKSTAGESALVKVEADPVSAYGSTVMAVAVTADYLLFLQQGDGDILVVSPDGEVSRPLPGDERLMANETTSLSQPKDVRSFRLAFQVLGGADPALVLVSTDGYSNSFQNEKGFLKVGSDLLGTIRAEGVDAVAAQLRGWLDETSAGGSGDDITLGLLCRRQALLAPPPPIQEKPETSPPVAPLHTGEQP